ncbi:cation diffusion facilitator family transporter [Propionibacterium australiense]|uniref:Cation diffusion facilitator family transporter n=1 Tax=Propionibacterium australiense TaxID=119981 RepID=A0A383S8C0_9ACTN|nr:cation diffusion facilitator family transporter [Propionibacterium australiense]RLP06991.1 cation diffusion facilitator family transporter [Propionibacterium australiense]RLP10799.1 cation diffusion facilitator family transporter [Propionibacterium australiense]SYZ34240.1 CDF: cation diffusion facilitator family transporter [Propionibacterium australiense]VEH89910.1 ferrous iron efflux protein F [Propionibacterium australiense]
MSEEGGTKATIAALAANLAIALTKFIAWLLTGASSMLSEAIHSLADTGNQVLLLIGGKQGSRGPSETHPFGHGRQRYINAFLVSVILFSVGGLFAIYEAAHKAGEVLAGAGDEMMTSRWWWVPIAVLLVSAVAESLSLRTALAETREQRRGRGVIGFVRATKSPELPAVLLEDLAALAGLILALVGIVLTLVTGNGIYDCIGSGLIGLLLIAVAVLLGHEMQSLLLGESASPETEAQIVAALTSTPGVESVIHMKTVHTGPEQILVAAKIAVTRTESAEYIAAVIDVAERNVRWNEPRCEYIYLEPDIRRSGYRPTRRKF